MNNLRVDARMALSRYESSVSAFGMEAGFPMKDVRVVQEYIDRLEATLLKAADRIEHLENRCANLLVGNRALNIRSDKLETALRIVINWDSTLESEDGLDWGEVMDIASKALETDNARP